MLFGNTPPQRPKGLFGMFAPGQGQIPMPQQQPMMPHVESDQVQRMQAMLNANRADQLQSAMGDNMGAKKPGINWLGVLADGLAGAAGQTPMYTQHLMQQKAMKQRQAMMEQQRQADWEDFQRQFDYKAKHDTPEPDAFERALLGAGYKPGTSQWTQMYAQRATTLANPIQFVPDGMGGVRPVQTFGSGAAEVPVGNFGPVVDQLPGGVSGNTGGGFPVKSKPTGFDSYKSGSYDPLEAAAGKEFGVPPAILNRLRVRGEKSNAGQVSEVGARSVYQITPETRQLIIQKYKFDPWANPQDAARGAAIVARDMYRKFGNWNDAMTGYHGGNDTRNWGPRTQAYTKRTSF